MKKANIITIMIVLLSGMFCIHAAAASASLSGTSSVRAGDTITLTYSVNGSNIFGASGDLSYDASQVTLTGTKQLISAPWAVEFNGNSFAAYDNNLTNPVNGNKSIFSATFKVNNVSVGASISVTIRNAKTSDGSIDSNIGNISWSATVLSPLSGNCDLSSLTVTNATISPAFNMNTTSYTASVPFEISKLNVSATAEDGKSKVSVNSPQLTPNGTTNVTVTVTAESGAKKTYTIKVSRAQDPNYKASGNNTLSSINVNGFVLSPPFSADVAQYVVWLPYETENVTVSGAPADGKASVSVEGGSNLEAGKNNEIKVICTAENGDKKEYIVVAKRASKDGGEIVGNATTTTKASGAVDANQPKTTSSGAPIWLVVMLCLLFAVIGAGTMFALYKYDIIKKPPELL